MLAKTSPPLQVSGLRLASRALRCPHTAHQRPLSTSSRLSRPQRTASAAEAASQLLETFSGTTVSSRQLIDGNQLQKLSLTLGRKTLADGLDVSEAAPPTGTPVPPGYHLVYFTPNGVEAELGPDGSDRTFNAPAPFTRRMWAGGRMKWPAETEVELRVGDVVEERTKLVGATPKKSRGGGEMVLVDVEKEFWGPRGLALVDQRSWIFRPEIDLSSKTSAPPPQSFESIERGPSKAIDLDCNTDGHTVRELRWSPVGLFRFSALTFNGHMIHYNQDWTRTVEGHPAEVVHGPLNLITMLNYWNDVHGRGRGGGSGQAPREISYRALSPLYAGETYTVRTGEVRNREGGKAWEILVEKPGVVCMRGEVLSD